MKQLQLDPLGQVLGQQNSEEYGSSDPMFRSEVPQETPAASGGGDHPINALLAWGLWPGRHPPPVPSQLQVLRTDVTGDKVMQGLSTIEGPVQCSEEREHGHLQAKHTHKETQNKAPEESARDGRRGRGVSKELWRLL